MTRMQLALAPFPGSISINYICHPITYALNQARCSVAAPVSIPDHPVNLRVWIEIPVGPLGHDLPREKWVALAAAWLIENCYEVEREIRAALIRPMFLN